MNVLFHLLWKSAPPILPWIAYALQIQSPPLPLPASCHITPGHLGKQLKALPYVYPIIFPCHDHRAGPPRSVQFNFSMEPCWWKLCGLGFRSVVELRCASWRVSHEGGSISEREGGGDLWWEPCYYGHLRTQLLHWCCVKHEAVTMLDLVTPTFRFLWPFFFSFHWWPKVGGCFSFSAVLFDALCCGCEAEHAQSKDGFSFACCALKFRALSSEFIDDCSDNFNPFKTPAWGGFSECSVCWKCPHWCRKVK